MISLHTFNHLGTSTIEIATSLCTEMLIDPVKLLSGFHPSRRTFYLKDIDMLSLYSQKVYLANFSAFLGKQSDIPLHRIIEILHAKVQFLYIAVVLVDTITFGTKYWYFAFIWIVVLNNKV